ncbi:hypothetical protein WDL1P1_00196 (plasmid) [Variovorax sp. WDL1]|nr:hypothetical protein CHC06_05780 [Variovorax sp. B2]PNG51030.1 hypothetical protein CHC07_05686 [Variovorax sp. B4]VTV17201.1 hypothetical protein WDL1P1_00196 [Variovorax sp. WDL1]
MTVLPAPATTLPAICACDAVPALCRARPGEFLARGRRRRPDGTPYIEFHRGAGICDGDFDFLKGALLEPRVTILSFLPPHPSPDPGLLVELAQRGYDLATFSFSVQLRSAPFAHPKRLRSVPQLKATLLARWGRVEYDCPDLCTSWGFPARRCDSSMLMGFFSTPRYTEGDGQSIYTPKRQLSFLEELKARHLDVRTVRMAVTRTQDDLPTVAP